MGNGPVGRRPTELIRQPRQVRHLLQGRVLRVILLDDDECLGRVRRFVLAVDDAAGTVFLLVDAELDAVPDEVGSDAVVGTTDLVHEEDPAEQRAPAGARPAEHHHDQQRQGEVGGRHVRRRAADQQRVDRARRPPPGRRPRREREAACTGTGPGRAPPTRRSSSRSAASTRPAGAPRSVHHEDHHDGDGRARASTG